MHSILRATSVVLSLFLAGCSSEYRIHLGAEELELAYPIGSSGMAHWKLAPERREYKRLAKWIEQNQDSWSAYHATTIAGGLYVDAKDWRLQFLENVVFVCPRQKGCWTKEIKRKRHPSTVCT